MCEQAQDSLTDQFWRAHKLVTEAGLYDVADWMSARWFGPDRPQLIDGSGVDECPECLASWGVPEDKPWHHDWCAQFDGEVGV